MNGIQDKKTLESAQNVKATVGINKKRKKPNWDEYYERQGNKIRNNICINNKCELSCVVNSKYCRIHRPIGDLSKEEKKSMGICTQSGCSNQVANGFIRCIECVEYSRKRYNLRQDRSVCLKCCNKRDDEYSICSICREKMKDKHEWRLANGRCIHCSNYAITGGQRCSTCVFKAMSSKATGSVNYWKIVKQIFDEQKGICALSGIQLELGNGASVDHIIPKSKGGSNDKNNLRIVHIDVNFMKSDMSDEELYQYCKLIVNKYETKNIN